MSQVGVNFDEGGITKGSCHGFKNFAGLLCVRR